MRDIIPNEDDIRLNQHPISEDWAKIRAMGENVKFNTGITLVYEGESIFDYLGVDTC